MPIKKRILKIMKTLLNILKNLDKRIGKEHVIIITMLLKQTLKNIENILKNVKNQKLKLKLKKK
jgi:hypothetical protein